ncbi:MAG TPA: hypothetical protein PLE57_09560, partial [Methanoregulaceae archaeon]|nr:hypothetical protein [Methanoregulaceae archaeon]
SGLRQLQVPEMPKPDKTVIRPPDDGLIRLGHFGYLQLALLFVMFFLYVGFRIYYARKYGEWESDEEQD